MKKSFNKYLKCLDQKTRKNAYKQFKKGKTIDCFTYDLDTFLANVLGEYLEHYLNCTSKMIVMSEQQKNDIEFMIYFFNNYTKLIEDKEYEQKYNKAFDLLKENFRGLWW